MVGSILLVAVLAVAAPQVQVGDLDGKTTIGTLTQLSSEGVALETNAGEVKIPLDRLLFLAPKEAPAAANSGDKRKDTTIELIDGSKLPVTDFTVSGGSAMVNIEPDVRFELSTKVIRKVRFKRPDDSQPMAWPADVGEGTAADLLAVRKKDHVDFLDGVIGKVTDELVVLKVDGVEYPVNRSKVDGLIYFHPVGDKPPEPICVVEDNGGWRLNVKEISFAESTLSHPRAYLDLTTTAGERLPLYWDTITRIDFSTGKIVYLSDLEPESVEWTPYIEFGATPAALKQYYAPRRDEGREHQPIRLGGKAYNKGLSLYSRTAAVYRLPVGMKTFHAIAGIDDSVRDGGNVRLEISADGKKLYDQAITGKDEPVEINLDISGAKRLSILVDYGENLDAGDYLNLAEARTLK